MWQPILPPSTVSPCRTSLLVAGYSVLLISDWLGGILLVGNLNGNSNLKHSETEACREKNSTQTES